MRNKIILLILLLPLISAITIYSGESVTLELDEPYEYYSIIGNSTPITLQLIQDGNNLTIIPDKYTDDDSFELIFFNSEKEIITKYESSGGGGGSSSTKTKYVDRDVIKYVNNTEYKDKIVKEPVEVVKNKVPIWIWSVLGALLLVVLYLYFIRINYEEDLESAEEIVKNTDKSFDLDLKENTNERGLKNNE